MQILLTYDISEGNPDRHKEIKQYLIDDKEYFDYYIKDKVRYNLPNTTLWKDNILTTKTGMSDLTDAVNVINGKFFSRSPMRVEKAICVEFEEISGMP